MWLNNFCKTSKSLTGRWKDFGFEIYVDQLVGSTPNYLELLSSDYARLVTNFAPLLRSKSKDPFWTPKTPINTWMLNILKTEPPKTSRHLQTEKKQSEVKEFIQARAPVSIAPVNIPPVNIPPGNQTLISNYVSFECNMFTNARISH